MASKTKKRGFLPGSASAVLGALMLSSSACGGITPFVGNTAINVAGDPPAIKVEAPPPKVVVQEEKIEINEKIPFDLSVSTIRRESFAVLDEIASVMSRHTELKNVRVEGHASSEGDDSLNLQLSKARASAVVEYLVAKGVARERLDSDGFGETRPVADNDTEDGRSKNRRVEFNIVERSTEAAKEASK